MDYHCIHIDAKANDSTKEAVAAIVKCYREKFRTSHIFISEISVPITTGHESVLEADLICLRELYLEKNVLWKYYLNPASSALPLRDHEDIREYLKTNSDQEFLDVQLNDSPERQSHLMVFQR